METRPFRKFEFEGKPIEARVFIFHERHMPAIPGNFGTRFCRTTCAVLVLPDGKVACGEATAFPPDTWSRKAGKQKAIINALRVAAEIPADAVGRPLEDVTFEKIVSVATDSVRKRLQGVIRNSRRAKQIFFYALLEYKGDIQAAATAFAGCLLRPVEFEPQKFEVLKGVKSV